MLLSVRHRSGSKKPTAPVGRVSGIIAPMRTTTPAMVLAALGAVGCAAPMLSRDGQVVFTEEGGRRGASVITANGVEFLDAAELPQPVVRRSVDEPWRPATGFLIPKDGVWRATSRPAAIQGHGLAVVLRASDALVPSWGGEVLLRIDALAPAEAFPGAAASLRPPERLAIVIDGHGPNAAPLVAVALDDLGGGDRVALVDSARARTIVPLVPGSHRTLLGAAAARVTASPASIRDLASAIAIARGWVAPRGAAPPGAGAGHVLVVTDGVGVAQGGERLARELGALRTAGVRVTAVGAPDGLDAAALAPLGPDVHAGGAFPRREDAVAAAVPPPGDTVLEDVVLEVSSVPAAARVIELSGGASAMALDRDKILLGDLYAGEARTEVARVALPVWVPGEPIEISVTATYRDRASGESLLASTTMHGRYSSDIEAIASARHGDVIAYASALAMVRRLDRAFAGSTVDRLGGLRPVVAQQARSLGELSRAHHDPALGAQAEVLTTLLGAIDD